MDKARTVIIVGPPWPGGGTARVMESQIEFYKSRGYKTVFICVPLHCAFVETTPAWVEIERGIRELRADHTMFAAINRRRFGVAKYTQWVKHFFRPTALNWTVMTARSADLSRECLQVMEEMQVVLIHVNHVFTFEFARHLARTLSKAGQRIPLILETHDIQAHALLEKREINPWTHRLDAVDRLQQSEISYLEKTKVLIHLSKDDFNFFEGQLPRHQHILALPTVPQSFAIDMNDEISVESDSIDLLFVGQSTEPNRAAIEWFFTEVWPLVRNHRYRVRVVGQIQMLVRETLPKIYESFGPCFVGTVRDLAPYYRNAHCVVAPMVSGTGISIKTIEALGFGKPFVGTSKAFRGMPLDKIVQAGLCAHDTPKSFANAIIATLQDQEKASKASRAVYMELFSRQAADAQREEAVRLALAS